MWLSLGLILEEGLDVALLRRVLDAVARNAADCEVRVATGDTKVVARGQCDSLFINTAGIGIAWPSFTLSPARIAPGDAVIVSGTLGDHGMAVMAARHGIGIATDLRSDTAPVHRLVGDLVEYGDDIRFLRDPTRGGLASVLNETVEGRGIGVELDETSLPASPGARAVAEMLGLDLLHVASEGRVMLVCAEAIADEVLRRWRGRPEGAGAVRVGTATGEAGRVTMRTAVGGRRLVDVPTGELLPRIC
jgi:hydrogenase expression/formation protein HypE